MEGIRSDQTCVHGRDRYQLGPFIFVCDQYTYEYPYHYGEVIIVATEFEYRGERHMIAKLCLGEDGDCIAGTLRSR